MIVAPGQTSVSITIQIVDDTGLPVTGLVASTFPATSYTRSTEATATITLSDLGAITSSWSSGGVRERSLGYYRLDVPNAAFATASHVRIIGEAAGKRIMFPVINVQEVAANVRQLAGTTLTVAGNVITLPAGLRLAPTTTTTHAFQLVGASNAYALVLTGGGYESVADATKGAIRIDVANQQGVPVDAVEIIKATASTRAINATGTIDANIVGNVTGNLSGSAGSVTGAVGSVTGAVASVTGAVGSITGVTFPTNFASLGINGSGHISRCVLLDTLTTYTGNTAQTGDSFARIGSTGSGLTTLAAASQIPAHFTTATFVSAGMFATAALANAPSGTGASAASIRAEMDSNSTRLANLDATMTSRMATYTQPTGFLAATFPSGTIANTTNITAGTVASVTVVNGLAANIITAASIATDAGTELAQALLDLSDGIETGLTPRGALRIVTAASAGKLSGAATSSVVIRNVGDTKPRITATVDADGNRSAVTTDPT